MSSARTLPLERLASVRSFADQAWDQLAPSELEPLLMQLFTDQARHAAGTCAFWAERLAEVPLGTSLTRRDLERIPLLFKRDLRLLKPYALVASQAQAFHLVRGTGGTTGAPVPMFWTKNDWRAAIESLARWLDPLRDLKPLRVFNAYNQAHVSGPSFDDVTRLLGGTAIPRHFRSTDEQAVQDILRFGVNALVITPRSGSGKGGSLEDLLAVEPALLEKAGIKALIVSSTPLEADMVAEIREQGVAFIVNFYGSTEALPDAVACPHDPTRFHLAQGPNLVEVVGPDGRHVASGQRGLVVASRIGAAVGDGIGPAEGTQLLRLVVGDEALYDETPCACGRLSARLSGIKRITDLDAKLLGGCERWE
jgi:phenylacetate-CoA ligase